MCLHTTAASKVFNIFELVEDILIHLPLEDLLLASNISNYTRQVVERSKPIFKRFLWNIGGFDERFELRHGNLDSADVAFACWNYLSHGGRYANTDMFVSRKGSHEAIAVLYRGRFGRGGWLKVVDGTDMEVAFKRVKFYEWDVKIHGKGLDQELHARLCPETSGKDSLGSYLLKFHRGSTAWVWSSRLQEFLPGDDKELEVEKELVVLD